MRMSVDSETASAKGVICTFLLPTVVRKALNQILVIPAYPPAGTITIDLAVPSDHKVWATRENLEAGVSTFIPQCPLFLFTIQGAGFPRLSTLTVAILLILDKLLIN